VKTRSQQVAKASNPADVMLGTEFVYSEIPKQPLPVNV